MPEVMLEHRHWAPPHRWPLWKWPIKPSSQTTLDLFTRRNLKPTPKPKRNTLIQALPDLRPLEIAVRDRLYTRCERGQNWGHNSIFSGCNYRPRAQSKCFLGTRIACSKTPHTTFSCSSARAGTSPSRRGCGRTEPALRPLTREGPAPTTGGDRGRFFHCCASTLMAKTLQGT